MMFFLALLLSAQFLLASAWKSLWARDLPVLPNLTIPLELTEDRKYLVSINMSPTQNVQRFHFAVTTGTGYSLVGGDNCTSCNIVGGYNQSESATAESLHSSGNLTFLGSSVVSIGGNVIMENCTMNTTNAAAPWVYPNQSIIVADQSSAIWPTGMTGVFGLGTNGLENDFNNTVIATWLRIHPQFTNFTYAMLLNDPQNLDSTDGGVLHWGQVDSNSYDASNVVQKDMIPMNSSSPLDSTGSTYDFSVQLDSWKLNAGNVTLSQTGSLMAILDPIVPYLIFPQEDATVIYGPIAGASMTPNGSISNVWDVPCDATLQVGFQFDSLTFTLDETSLITKTSKGKCVGTIQSWQNTSITQYLLGSSLISKLYLMFVISGASTGTVGFANRINSASGSSGLSTGQVVGIAVGSAGFIAVLALVAFMLYRRRQKRRPGDQVVQPQQDQVPFSKEAHSNQVDPYILGLDGGSQSPQSSQYSPVQTIQHHLYYPTGASPPISPHSPQRSLNHTIEYSNVTSSSSTGHMETPPPYAGALQVINDDGRIVSHQSSNPTLMQPPQDRKAQKRQM